MPNLVAADGTMQAVPYEPGDWRACDFPERPFDEGTVFHGRPCRSCLVALDVAIRITVDDEALRASMLHMRPVLAGES